MSILVTKYDPLVAPLLNTGYANPSDVSGVNSLTVFQGVEGQQFSMATFVTEFDGSLFYTWATNNGNEEDGLGQWIKYAIINPTTMAVTHTGTVVAQDLNTWRTACGLWVRGSDLFALVRTNNEISYYKFVSTAAGWSYQGILFNGYLMNEAPQAHDGKWWVPLRNSGGTYLASGDIGNWDIQLVPETTGNNSIEPTLIFHNNEPNLILRNNTGAYLYRHYAGTTQLTNYPDARSKSHRVRLPDGRVAMLGNAIPYAMGSNRTKLHIGLGPDGLRVDTFKVVHKDPPPMKWGAIEVRNGWNYPNALVLGSYLYIASSLNKQDAVLSRVPLSSL